MIRPPVMKLRWQPFLFICGIVAAFSGMVASCGPERPFCPYGPDPEYICLPDAGSSAGGERRQRARSARAMAAPDVHLRRALQCFPAELISVGTPSLPRPRRAYAKIVEDEALQGRRHRRQGLRRRRAHPAAAHPSRGRARARARGRSRGRAAGRRAPAAGRAHRPAVRERARGRGGAGLRRRAAGLAPQGQRAARARHPGGGRQDRRHVGRLPAARRRGLRALLRRAPPAPGAAGGGDVRLRPARAEPRRRSAPRARSRRRAASRPRSSSRCCRWRAPASSAAPSCTSSASPARRAAASRPRRARTTPCAR